jgi:hypothetical protein
MTTMKHSNRKLTGSSALSLAVFALGLLLTSPAASWADDAKTSSTASAAPTASGTDIALKDMRDELRRLHRAALDLISEVEQRDMVVVGQPQLIQPIPEKSDPHPGTMEEMIVLGDALPPRKKWLDLTMAEVEKLVALIQQDKAALVVPSDQTAATSSLKSLDDLIADIQKRLDSLKTLTAGPKYQNIEIGKEALGIFEDTKKIEQPWKDLVHALRAK